MNDAATTAPTADAGLRAFRDHVAFAIGRAGLGDRYDEIVDGLDAALARLDGADADGVLRADSALFTDLLACSVNDGYPDMARSLFRSSADEIARLGTVATEAIRAGRAQGGRLAEAERTWATWPTPDEMPRTAKRQPWRDAHVALWAEMGRALFGRDIGTYMAHAARIRAANPPRTAGEDAARQTDPQEEPAFDETVRLGALGNVVGAILAAKRGDVAGAISTLEATRDLLSARAWDAATP